MLRDVLVASINKGQFPFALVGLVVLVSLLKMPPADVSKLVFRVVDSLSSGWWGGYALTLLVSIAWSAHARFLQRALNAEVRRTSLAHAKLVASVHSGRNTSSEVRS
ncbi:MAG: hypothetical protein WDO56_14220 [Gammaproteobacteria bacterium]